MTPGEMMFYGGIAGMILIGAAGIIAAVVMSRGRRRLRAKLDQEYGRDDR